MRRRGGWMLFFFLSATGGCWQTGWAAEPAAELEAMVVTATRRPTTIQNAPAVVNVITREEIERTPHRNLAELLETQTGIYTFQPQGTGIVTPPDIRLRGTFGTERVLLLVDGQPFDDPYTNYWYFSQVPLEAVQRIEIVRGPYSALYGTGALGGVINVITRDGWGRKGADASYAIRGGNFGTLESVATASAGDGKRFSLALSHQYFETNNYVLNDSERAKRSIRDGLNNRASDQNRVHLNGRFDPVDRVSLNFSGGYFGIETGFGHSPINGAEKINELTNYYGNLRGRAYAAKDVELFFGLDYFWRDRPTDGDTALDQTTVVRSVNTNKAQRLRGQAGAHWSVTDNNVLSLGAEAWRIQAEQTIQDRSGNDLAVFYRPAGSLDTVENNYALFLQNDLKLFDGELELIAGLRYDNYGDTGDAFSPKGALLWHYLPTGRVKLSAAKAFRSPSISERKSPFWNLTVQPYPFPVVPPPGQGYFAVSYESNEDLDSETLYSCEVSLENEFLNRRLSTRITPFYVKGKDFISTVNRTDTTAPGFFVPFPPPGRGVNFSTLTRVENIDEISIKGLESEVTARPLPELTLFANHLYQDGKNEENNTPLDFYPKNVFHTGARWYSRHINDVVGVGGSVVGRYLSSYHYTALGGRDTGTLHGYTTVDLFFGLDFWQKRISLAAGIQNLLDEDKNYKTSESVLPERNYLIGIGFHYRF